MLIPIATTATFLLAAPATAQTPPTDHKSHPANDGGVASAPLRSGMYQGMLRFKGKVPRRRAQFLLFYDTSVPSKVTVRPVFSGACQKGFTFSGLWLSGVEGSPALTLNGNRFSGTVRAITASIGDEYGLVGHYTWSVSGTILSAQKIAVRLRSAKVRFTKRGGRTTVGRCTSKPASGAIRY
jgi:hypothetical protein